MATKAQTAAAKKPAAKATKATPEKTSSKELVTKKATALVAVGISIEEDAGLGFEMADKDSFAIPFLRVLQSGSPQCKKANPDYIKGAEEGDFFNTVTKEVFKGGEEGTPLNLIAVHYDRKFTEWAPNRGGFRGEHLPSAPILTRAVKKTNDEGKEQLTLPGGNTISDTRYHFCLHLKDDGSYSPVLVTMASSGLKVSRRFMTELNSVKIKNGDGRSFTPPMFLNKIEMTSVPESNDEGDWYNYNMALNGTLDIMDGDEAEIYLAAKAFRDSITAGKATVNHNEEEGSEAAAGADGKF